MATARKKTQGKSTGHRYGGWEFARDASNHLFGLLNTGKIYPAFGVMILAIMGLIVWKLPGTQLAELVRDFFLLLRSSFGLMFALFLMSNTMWLWLFRRQKRLYENEIDRLALIRSDLMHKGSGLIPISEHRSSNDEQKESYILPGIDEKEDLQQ